MQGQDGGYTGPGVSQVVQAKISPQLCFAWGTLPEPVKQSEMTATCAGLGDSWMKPRCKSKLLLLVPSLGLTEVLLLLLV